MNEINLTNKANDKQYRDVAEREVNMNRKVSIRERVGDVFVISLQGGKFAYGRVIRAPMYAFYDLESSEILPIDTIVSAPIAFKLCVMKDAISKARWKILGCVPLTAELDKEVLFFKKDHFTGRITIFSNESGTEVNATKEDCIGLERASVWEAEHVEQRLQDHFTGRPNYWVESMKL